MRFVQYYDYNLAGGLDTVLGDRGVVVLDARNTIENSIQDAIAWNGVRRRYYPAFQLFQGRSFADCTPISNIITL